MVNIDKSKFMASNGNYITGNLFWDYQVGTLIENRTMDPVFTLYKDKPGLINFGKRYVELRDPTGYKVSQELLVDYRHWQALMNRAWFKAAKAVWDEELDALLSSEGMDTLRLIAKDGQPAQALVAAKFLAQKQYKDKHAKGRPTKAMVEAETKKMAQADKDTSSDMERMLGGNRG